MNCSIVIPVYHGEDTIIPLVEQLALELPKIAEEYEAILVNDCSPDASWERIEGLTHRFPWVVGMNLMRNYGQHNATLCGVRGARYEITITMDDDLQHPPEEIHHLLPKLDEGYDVVYGAPRRLPQGFWRNQTTRYTKIILARVMGVPSVRNMSAFRAFRTDLRGAFSDFRSPNTILDVLLSWGTSRITAVPVDIEAAKSSNYDLGSLVKATLLVLTGYSTGPLRLATWIGMIMTLFGLAIFVYVVTTYFTLGSLPGFPFLASIVSLFSGAQLFTLGIIGEYLSYMFDRSMGRPGYVVRETIGGGNP
jgi:glycosyltransferase involved in cell wall biosynthesis